MHSLKLNMLLFISMDRWLIIIVIMAAWRHWCLYHSNTS
jgi:hypothetical protein